MTVVYHNPVSNITITIEPSNNINMALIFVVVGLRRLVLGFLGNILPGRRVALAYCRQENRGHFSSLPLNINSPFSLQSFYVKANTDRQRVRVYVR